MRLAGSNLGRRAVAFHQYALVVGLIAVIALAAVTLSGHSLSTLFFSASNKLNAASNGGGTQAQAPSDPGPGSPAPFGFTNLPAASPSTNADSEAVTLTGFTGPLTATCGGNCTAINRNSAGWQASPVSGFLPNDTIAIRQPTSTSQGTTLTATVSVSMPPP